MRLFRMTCICMLIFGAVCAMSASRADTLTIPSGMSAIEEEAFFGDSSLRGVKLPDGLLSIGARLCGQRRHVGEPA